MSDKPSGNVRSSIRLSFLNTVFAGVLQFATMGVLARLLDPAEYGIFALATAIAGLSAVFVTNVLERTLVVTAASGDEGDDTLPIAMFCLLAMLIALAVCAGLDWAGLGHFDLGVLAVISFSSIITCGAIPPRVVLRRRIEFGPIVLAETSGLIVGQGIVAIGLAWLGWGAYALAVGACLQSLVITLMLRARVRGARINPPTPRHMVGMARSATALGGNAAAEIVNGQTAPLILGMRLGEVALGLFNRSYSLVQMPIQLLVASMSRVMISALFSAKDDIERLRAMARSLVRVAAVMAIPVAAGIAGASRNFVLFAFGAKWLAAQSIMPLLAVGAIGVMMGTLYGIIAESMRAFADKTRNQVASTVMLVVLALAGAHFGLVGAVAGVAASGLLFLLLFARLAARLLGLPILAVLGWLAPGMIAGLPCLAISLALGHYLHGPSALVFAAQIAGCGVADGLAMLLLFPALTLQIIEGMAPGVLRLMPPLTRHLRRSAEVRPA